MSFLTPKQVMSVLISLANPYASHDCLVGGEWRGPTREHLKKRLDELGLLLEERHDWLAP